MSPGRSDVVDSAIRADALGYLIEGGAANLRELHGFLSDTVLHLVHLDEVHQRAGEHDNVREAWRRALVVFDEIGHLEADALRARVAAHSSV